MKNTFGQIVKYVMLISTASWLFACEDEIAPTLEGADAIAVIDAWITNKPGDQLIKITSTRWMIYATQWR